MLEIIGDGAAGRYWRNSECSPGSFGRMFYFNLVDRHHCFIAPAYFAANNCDAQQLV